VGRAIVLATPVFLALIALEYAWGRRAGRNTYGLADAVSSIALGVMSQYTAVFTRLLRVGIYAAAASSLSLVPAEAAAAFWTSPLGWVLALVFYDFCYYWLHRAGHESAIFRAAHVVHHQSRHYNLSAALRQTSSGALLGWVFYLPMAVAGVPPQVFAIVALVDLLYQFWVHSEHVGRLGWFDRWFVSPSNHRVHHAFQDGYLDRNYGGVLVVWDRLFGTFVEEGERCTYGTRKPLDAWDPVWANVEVYAAIARDAWHARGWRDRLRVVFGRPGWRPADVPALAAVQAGGLDWATLGRACKPLVLGLAAAWAWRRWRAAAAAAEDARAHALLVAALLASLAGDVALMVPGGFLPGLVAFLLAHVAYVALFARGVGVLPRHGAAPAVALYGLAMLAVLWPHLPPGLGGPVAAYVAVISAMGAQAIGRALVRRDAASVATAAGALLFVASDTVLALDRFVGPVPLAPFWILSTYFTAQLLIARHALPDPSARRAAALPVHVAG
jgi:sterol desaturase/sphingolipid hydroxylase (fatty acid hydroxylase superfamily)/uncharacterized membrane protein YhhN